MKNAEAIGHCKDSNRTGDISVQPSASTAMDIFVDPHTLEPLKFNHSVGVLGEASSAYAVIDGVVDFYSPIAAPPSDAPNVAAHCTDLATEHARAVSPVEPAIDSAPELRSAYESAFTKAKESGGNIYGSLEEAAAIVQSGHVARMQILSELELGDIENKVAVDFGTGPWGFAAIFDNLRKARVCIGFDVSKTALELARKSGPPELLAKSTYATSDGERIPLADNSVDIFFGGEVIEHVRNPFLFAQEIARVCKDGALVILTTPNRDAFSYKLRNVQYCVGPEHIALLNYEEFEAVLGAFTDNIQIFGYDTSLGPTEDHLPAPAALLDKYQARARANPRLASGMISSSRVRKDLYERNRRHLNLREVICHSASASFEAPPNIVPLFDSVTGALLPEAGRITIDVSGRYLSLLFWGHDWSGMVEVRCGTQSSTHDLYSPAGGWIRINLENHEGAQQLRIRPTGEKRAEAHAAQVIFYKLIEYSEA